jgi:hypothetical protein
MLVSFHTGWQGFIRPCSVPALGKPIRRVIGSGKHCSVGGGILGAIGDPSADHIAPGMQVNFATSGHGTDKKLFRLLE